MWTKLFAIGLIVALNSTVYAAEVQSGPKVYVEPTVSYANGVDPDAQVVSPDCRWNGYVVERLVKEAEGRVVVTPNLAGVDGRKLFMQASVSAEATPASELSTRWLEVSAKLVDENSKVLGESAFRRETDSGTLRECKNTQDLSKDLGDDISHWLEKPVFGIKIATAVTALRADIVDDGLKSSCPWDRMLPRYLAEKSDGAVYRVSEDIESATGKKLILKVANVRALGGGWITGAKWLKVVGSLVDNNQVVGSFVALRHSIRSPSRCGSFERVSNEIGDDILEWLQHPGMNAKLGNADATDTAEP